MTTLLIILIMVFYVVPLTFQIIWNKRRGLPVFASVLVYGDMFLQYVVINGFSMPLNIKYYVKRIYMSDIETNMHVVYLQIGVITFRLFNIVRTKKYNGIIIGPSIPTPTSGSPSTWQDNTTFKKFNVVFQRKGKLTTNLTTEVFTPKKFTAPSGDGSFDNNSGY